METYYLLLAAYWIERFNKQVLDLAADTSKPNHFLDAGEAFGLIPRRQLSESASTPFFFRQNHFEREMLSPITQSLNQAMLQRDAQNLAAQRIIIHHYRQLNIYIQFEDYWMKTFPYTVHRTDGTSRLGAFQEECHGFRIRVGKMH